MIYPYDKNKKIIKEDVIKELYPLTYKYLLSVRSKLETRDKGFTLGYESWYAYGRKQGLQDISSKEVISIPKMIGGNCKPIKLDISSLLEEYGKLVFTSGYILPIEERNKEEVLSFLNSDFINYSKEKGKPWSGKESNYYSLTTKQIKSFLTK